MIKYKDGTVCNERELHEQISRITENLLIEYRGRTEFYALVLNVTNRILVDDTHVVKTAGLGLQGIKYKLFININFWNKLKENEKGALLIHEIEHSIYGHPLVGVNYESPRLHNIATDLGINTRILEITKDEDVLPGACLQKDREEARERMSVLQARLAGGLITKEELEDQMPILPIHPDDYTEDLGMTREQIANASADELYKKLLELDEDGKENGSNLAQDLAYSSSKRHGHSDWEDLQSLPDAVKDVMEDQLKSTLKDVSKSYNPGSLPNHLRDKLEEILTPPKPVNNWKQEVRNFITGRGSMTLLSRTRSKPNLLIPDGFRLKFKPNKHILLALDTSGSMSLEQDIKEVLTESVNIKRVTNSKITVITGDVKATDKWELKNKHTVQKVMASGIIGRGGTDTRWILEYLSLPESKGKYSAVIYLTDLFVNPPAEKPNLPFLCLASSKMNEMWKSVWNKAGYKVISLPKNYLNL